MCDEIRCCGYVVIWKDCLQHDNDCYYYMCEECGERSMTDCEEVGQYASM